MPLKKIVSGGQTGADIAGIDAAIAYKFPYGRSIPKGRLTEDGSLPEQYNLQEMPTASYPKRTAQNVIDSDGTVILTHGALTGGSLLTRKVAVQHGAVSFDASGKPLQLVDFPEVEKENHGAKNFEPVKVEGKCSRGHLA